MTTTRLGLVPFGVLFTPRALWESTRPCRAMTVKQVPGLGEPIFAWKGSKVCIETVPRHVADSILSKKEGDHI